MRALSAQELISVGERGLAGRPFERALAILSAASPESSPAALARLSIGRRDANLLRLREWAFGPELAIVTTCPSCREALELTMPVASLRVSIDPTGEPTGDLERSLPMQ